MERIKCTIWGVKKVGRRERNYLLFDGVKSKAGAMKFARGVKKCGFISGDELIMPDKVGIVVYAYLGEFGVIPPIVQEKIIL